MTHTALHDRQRGKKTFRRGFRALLTGLVLLSTAPGLASCGLPGQAAAPTPVAAPVRTSPPPPSASRPGADPRAAVLAAPWPLSPADTKAYNMVIMADGYPGKRVGDRVAPHPIYATYLMRGFLDRARKGDPLARPALAAVAHAVVRRMQPYRGALVFWYTRETVPLERVGARAYSALTQAYYADLLYQAGQVLGDRGLRDAAGKVFASLVIPVAHGGVLRPGRLGPVLEEEPTRVPSAILNGWLSALLATKSYAARSHSRPAAELLRTSVAELATRVSRYDLPAVLGSSYSATALLSLRIDAPPGTLVRSAELIVDAVPIPLNLTGDGLANDVVRVGRCGARTPEGVRSTCAGLELDVPVTAAGIDPTSVVRLGLRGPGGALSATLRLGRYEFRHGTGRTVTGWGDEMAVRSRTATGTATVHVGPERLREAQTPTTFRRYGGHLVNGYHIIHVSRLKALAADGGPLLAAYSQHWRQYRCRWATHPAYQSLPRADLTC